MSLADQAYGILVLRSRGVSDKKIAAALSVDAGKLNDLVSLAFKRNGRNPEPRKGRVGADEIPWDMKSKRVLVRNYNLGRTNSFIAKTLGRSLRSVEAKIQHLKKTGEWSALGAKGYRHREGAKVWTELEDTMLRIMRDEVELSFEDISRNIGGKCTASIARHRYFFLKEFEAGWAA